MLTGSLLGIIFVISALLLASLSQMTRKPLLILFLCLTLSGYSQPGTTVGPDVKPGSFALDEIAGRVLLDSIYATRTGTQYAFINGTEYFPYHYRAKHKPLLFYGEDRTSEITVSGRKHKGIKLQYDTFTDEVIFSEIDNDFGRNLYLISIKPDLIGGFTLFFRTDTLRFRYFSSEETRGEIQPGFYETAYNGTTKYIIRHRSVVHQRNGIDEYYHSPAGYVITPQGYKRISSGNKFFKLFGEGSAEMKKIVDRQGINLRKAGKRQIINVLQAYDNRSGAVK